MTMKDIERRSVEKVIDLLITQLGESLRSEAWLRIGTAVASQNLQTCEAELDHLKSTCRIQSEELERTCEQLTTAQDALARESAEVLRLQKEIADAPKDEMHALLEQARDERDAAVDRIVALERETERMRRGMEDQG